MGCMNGNTQITMADGSKKKISDVHSGDIVRIVDGRDSKITTIITGWEESLIEIKTTNGTYIQLTSNQPVIEIKTGWKRTSDLKVGDVLLSYSGHDEIEIIEKAPGCEVYNICLEAEGGVGFYANDIAVGDFAVMIR